MRFGRWLSEQFECYCSRPSASHNIRLARNRLVAIRKIKSPGAQFNYMRTIAPFIFEEMVMTCFKDRGIKIFRSEGYTGDGGVDGEIVFNGRNLFIQTKRYTGDIKANDVLDFLTICNQHRVCGLFVHTGKTGPRSWDVAGESVFMVSGNAILDLLNGRAFRIFNAEVPADPAIPA